MSKYEVKDNTVVYTDDEGIVTEVTSDLLYAKSEAKRSISKKVSDDADTDEVSAKEVAKLEKKLKSA